MALILARRVGQGIVLTQDGVNTFVRIKSIKGGNVHLEFTAPDKVAINRREIYLLKQQQILNNRIGEKP
jgi:carbon storage regulator CsrA